MPSRSFSIPTLHLRKDIWQNFPVHLIPLGKGDDGAERHAIVWNRKSLNTWRATHSNSSNDWMKYEMKQTALLLAALNQSKKWILETPIQDEHICVIRMGFQEQTEHNQPFIRVPSPILTCLNDIKAFFPVVWHEVSNQSTDDLGRTYAIELYGKKMKSLSHIDQEDVVECLYSSLKSSTAWKVLPPVMPNEFCRIHL